jgi:hypothetical protein
MISLSYMNLYQKPPTYQEIKESPSTVSIKKINKSLRRVPKILRNKKELKI